MPSIANAFSAAGRRVASWWSTIRGANYSLGCIRRRGPPPYEANDDVVQQVEVGANQETQSISLPSSLPPLVSLPAPELVKEPPCYRFVLEENAEAISSRLSVDSFGAKIGKGSFGQVFVGYGKLSDGDTTATRYALKVQSRKYLTGDANKAWYSHAQREVNIHQTLHHPNVVHMFSYVFLDKTEADKVTSAQHMVMKTSLSDDSLSGLLRKVNKLSTSACVFLAKEFCDGLEYLHSKFVCHHDLKSGNLVVNYSQENPDSEVHLLRVKIIDFGHDKRYDSADQVIERHLTAGTPFFKALEKAIGIPYDPYKSDGFSLAVTIYQALMGRKELKLAKKMNTSFFAVSVEYIASLKQLKEEDKDQKKYFLAAMLQSLLMEDPNFRSSVGNFSRSIADL